MGHRGNPHPLPLCLWRRQGHGDLDGPERPLEMRSCGIPITRLEPDLDVKGHRRACVDQRAERCSYGVRRPDAADSEIEAALLNLDEKPRRIRASAWPADLANLDLPGLYSWWVDPKGADALSIGLGSAVVPGRIYAGQTGATKWPSGTVGSATLRGRIGGNHLSGRIRGSTFRLTLAAVLGEPLELIIEGSKKLSRDSEASLSAWMAAHLEVAVHPFSDRARLADLESRVLAVLDPPLNLEGRPQTAVRARLRTLRADVAAATEAEEISSAVAAPSADALPPRGSASDGESGRQVTLHEEIAAILDERGGWMATQELADAVNARGRYSKRDGSPVDAFQIHGRTKNYPHLFERDGIRVRLRSPAP